MNRLLIVDDSKIIRRRIRRVHGLDNYSVVGSAEDGIAALQIAKKTLPDVITMDLTMPHMDGIDTIPKLAKICPHARILVISALADKSTSIKALSLGAHGFLCKPFTDFELEDALKELVSPT